jgi:hypothetical protein
MMSSYLSGPGRGGKKQEARARGSSYKAVDGMLRLEVENFSGMTLTVVLYSAPEAAAGLNR